MADGRAARHRLAYAFLFLLAMREVTAARDSFNAQQLATQVGKTLKAADAHKERHSSVTDAGEFSIRTMWASGAEDSLRWQPGDLTFRFKDGGGASEPSEPMDPMKYVELLGAEESGSGSHGSHGSHGSRGSRGSRGLRVRLLPDAVVLTKEIEGMAVLGLSGYQAYDFDKKRWLESDYEHKLFIRTEMNRRVGTTTSSWWGRLSGLPVYEAKQSKSEKKESPVLYYVNEKGKVKTIDAEDVSHASQSLQEPLLLRIPGFAAAALKHPDRELMAMVDGMLGEASCLGQPSTCAFRCFYDSDRDICGPAAFCAKVGPKASRSNLAPFGSQQKCQAVGGEDTDTADRVLAETALETLKNRAVSVAQELMGSEAVSWSSSSRSSLQASVALWLEAADLLNVLETLPARLAEASGSFPRAERRVQATDLKHWRRRPDRLTINEYEAAARAELTAVRDSNRFSVAAKLHSELVAFVTKRPSVLMHYVRGEEEKCTLADDTEAARAQVATFVKYFLKVPGYNSEDLSKTALPEPCAAFLRGDDQIDVEQLSQDVAQGEQALSQRAGLIELNSQRLSGALGGSFLETGDALGEETEKVRQQFVIIASIIVGLVCLVVAGVFFIAALANKEGCMKQSGVQGGEHCLAFLVCNALGGLVIFGAFAMSLAVGVGALAGAMFLVHYAATHYLLQTNQHELHGGESSHRMLRVDAAR